MRQSWVLTVLLFQTSVTCNSLDVMISTPASQAPGTSSMCNSKERRHACLFLCPILLCWKEEIWPLVHWGILDKGKGGNSFLKILGQLPSSHLYLPALKLLYEQGKLLSVFLHVSSSLLAVFHLKQLKAVSFKVIWILMNYPHRKVEDLQFRVEEESITKGDLEVK